MADVTKFVTTVVAERFSVFVERDINWLMIKRLVLVRYTGLYYTNLLHKSILLSILVFRIWFIVGNIAVEVRFRECNG